MVTTGPFLTILQDEVSGTAATAADHGGARHDIFKIYAEAYELTSPTACGTANGSTGSRDRRSRQPASQLNRDEKKALDNPKLVRYEAGSLDYRKSASTAQERPFPSRGAQSAKAR